MTIIHEYTLSELEAHPERLLSLLKEPDTAWIMRREGDRMMIQAYPVYSETTQRLLVEAKKIYQAKREAGYSRVAAIKDFDDAQQKIVDQLS